MYQKKVCLSISTNEIMTNSIKSIFQWIKLLDNIWLLYIYLENWCESTNKIACMEIFKMVTFFFFFFENKK